MHSSSLQQPSPAVFEDAAPAAQSTAQQPGCHPSPTPAANAAPAPAQGPHWHLLPPQLRTARQWLAYRLEPNPDPTKKPRKVPYYIDGGKRQGTLDTPQDMARLVTFDEAMAAWHRLSPDAYAGLAIALNNGWQGIDLDDVPQNQLADLANELPGYVELSPSGNGCHAIGYGRQFAALGSNWSGIEAYSSGRFFTVTGNVIRSDALVDLAPYVEQRLAPRHVAHRSPVASLGGTVSIAPQAVTELRSALNAIPADDRHVWVRVGMACKTLGESVGYELWATWSQRSRKWDPQDASRTWDSFEPRDITHLSIFKLAQDCGWVNPASKAAQVAAPPLAASPNPVAATGTPTASGPLDPFGSVSIADLKTNPAPHQAFIVADLAPAREVTLLPADGGTGKSILMLQAAVCVAMGLPFMGKRVIRCKVIYYSAEDDDDTLRNRLLRIVQHYGVDPAVLAQWLCVVDATESPCLFSEYRDKDGIQGASATDNLKRLALTMAAARGDTKERVAVFVDNASDTYDASEIIRAQVRGFIRGLKAPAKQFEGSVILLAHLDKESVRNPNARAKFSGSTAWHNSVRSRLLLEPHNELPATLVLSQEKNNHGPRSNPILLEWNTEGVLELCSAPPTDEDLAPDAKSMTEDERMLHVLGLIRKCHANGIPIGASFGNAARDKPYAVLSAHAEYPKWLNARQLEKLLLKAVARKLVQIEDYKDGRSERRRWRFPDAGNDAAAK